MILLIDIWRFRAIFWTLLSAILLFTSLPVSSYHKEKPTHLFKPKNDEGSKIEAEAKVSFKNKSFDKNIKANSIWSDEGNLVSKQGNKKSIEKDKLEDSDTEEIIDEQISDMMNSLGFTNFFGWEDKEIISAKIKDISDIDISDLDINYVSKPKFESFNFYTPISKPKISDLIKTRESLPTILDTDKKSLKSISFKPDIPSYLDKLAPRRLRMYNLHTNERINIIYWKNGDYIDSALKKIDYFLRDFRQNETISIDVKLLNLINKIATELRYEGEIHVISGYRSIKTQKQFLKQGRKVARISQHSLGKAVDIRLPGIPTKKLSNIAKSFKAGGVGYYPRDRFVHIDTGNVRYW